MHAEITPTTTNEADALTYWQVESVDEPIAIVPFLCGRYVCPNHQDDQTTEGED